MIDDLRTRLSQAAQAGEIVRIVYHGGSQPGTVRGIVPIAIIGDELRARDVASEIDKTFKLAHVELAGLQTCAAAYNPSMTVCLEGTRSVQEASASHVPALEGMGWHVEVTANRISLHRFFKNGKPRRSHDVTMGFDEFTVDMFDDFDGRGLQTVTRPSKRPYNVSSLALQTRTFVRLSQAMALFLEEARRLAP